MKLIEILGPGCARCEETYRVVRHVVEAHGVECALRKVEEVGRMVELGVLQTPAVAVDGQVVLAGRIPKADEVVRALGL